MKPYCENIKDILKNHIHDLAENIWLFSHEPGKNFTRNRKLPAEKILTLLVSMGGHTMRDELMDCFGCNAEMASVPAFVQQRSKIMPEALEFLFQEFVNSCDKPRLFRGYRLLAVDGTDLQIFANPRDMDSYYPGTNGKKHYSLLHLNAMYDLESRTYLDAVIQKSRKSNENAALIQMVDRSILPQPVIVLADRGYESYNNIAHIERKGWKYLIRIKEIHGILDGFHIQRDKPCDFTAHIILTKKGTNEVKTKMKENPGLYRFVPSSSTFDFLDLHTNLFYELNFRIVRFTLPNGTFETVITNLPQNLFSADELKSLYFRRWGIETSFRNLKHTVALNYFQSKKVEHICQEIFARLIMYNFCELITSHVLIHAKSKKYVYQTNFSAAVHICRLFLRGSVSPPNVEATLERFLLPIRPGRQEPRKIKSSKFFGFLYRIA